MRSSSLTGSVIGAAIDVHRALGPGLLESVYQACLQRELDVRGVPYEGQVSLPIRYKGLVVPSAYRVDLRFADRLIVEIKAVETVLPVHEAQLLTYMRLSSCRVGLLMNFNVPVLRRGLRRFVL